MTVLFSPGSATPAAFTASSALNTLPDGNGTIAAIFNSPATDGVEICGLLNSAGTDWYHTLTTDGGFFDDDGQVGSGAAPTWIAGDWYILVATWTISGGVATETYHIYNLTAGGSWTHASASNNGGARAVSGAKWVIGPSGDGGNEAFDIALCAAWAGIALTNTQVEALSANKKTSDWYNNAGGHPTLLVECTSITPTDIGSVPSTFTTIGSLETDTEITFTWTFDGHGSGGGSATAAGAVTLTSTVVSSSNHNHLDSTSGAITPTSATVPSSTHVHSASAAGSVSPAGDITVGGNAYLVGANSAITPSSTATQSSELSDTELISVGFFMAA